MTILTSGAEGAGVAWTRQSTTMSSWALSFSALQYSWCKEVNDGS